MAAGCKPDMNRRQAMKAGLGTATLFLPMPTAWVWAQSEGAVKLLRVPKMALVLGNSRYVRAPALVNPGNDAKAISDVLSQSGFDVATKLDATLDDMAAAIRAYVQTLAARKAVGLFYFAGHGVQLAWRNYLVPVDAVVRGPEDIQRGCVDLTSLIEGINKASNPMNVVILDACRDNPFGADVRTEARGLSQMDAPHSTLLAYATAPGNVASDGEGANGLYTENLLREMRVPDAKIEDVFKRVRLNVRRRTNGQQIPWESTSLEEDFWFVPPKELKQMSEAEAAREFEVELAIWEKIKNSKELEPLVDYLQRYPGGKFSELAQFQLDRVLAAQGEKKIEVVSNEKNPYSKGSARTDTRYRVGDRYNYREIDILTGIESRRLVNTVTEITEDKVIFGKGGTVTDLLGNPLKRGGASWVGCQIVPLEFSVGRRWNTRFLLVESNGNQSNVQLAMHISAREKITVPAGSFNAFRVEAQGWRTGSNLNVNWNLTVWYAPEVVRYYIAWEYANRRAQGGYTSTQRYELTAFKQS